MSLSVLDLSGHAHSLSCDRSERESSDMRSRLILPPGASSLMLHMLRLGAAHPNVVRKTSGKCPESVEYRKDIRGRVGCTEAMEPEEIFFVMLVFSLVSKIVLCGREGGGHAWKAGHAGKRVNLYGD